MNLNNNLAIKHPDSITCDSCWIKNSSFETKLQEGIRINIENSLIQFKKGDAIFKVGDKLTGVYCIKKGSVKIVNKGNKINEFILWVAVENDVVGLHSFMNQEPFTYSAIALEDVSTCFITVDALNHLIQTDPISMLKTMNRICEKLNFIEQRITSISGKKMREQCAEILISVATKSESENDKRYHINYSITDLAGLIGTTKNYLYKILLEFTSQEILILHNRKFTIKDMSALSSIALGDQKSK